ncbi:hypothetical protein EC844_12558 [Acinetobacter calcoaceticus]|uniref:Uncharacterized protein n=1 Tax=Acinetobacter calcoaceticus TaxID=471 RepID=A0A4R1XJP5_ACICA|nr:hypothetical protein EC844_12558 [Acinetobacter calcoaceticus]
MKNMKIEINAEQPLDEVVMELERLGYGLWDNADSPSFVVTHRNGLYQMAWNDLPRLKDWPLTTLTELRQMEKRYEF